MLRFVAVPTTKISAFVQEKLLELGYRWTDREEIRSCPTKHYGVEACIGFSDLHRCLEYSPYDYYKKGSPPYVNAKEISIRDIFVSLLPFKKEEPEKMIDIDGKKFSESTIKEALKNHVGA